MDNLERIASNEQKNLAKEISKMVQKEFWNKVEKVAFLFHEKRNGYLDRIWTFYKIVPCFRPVWNHGAKSLEKRRKRAKETNGRRFE